MPTLVHKGHHYKVDQCNKIILKIERITEIRSGLVGSRNKNQVVGSRNGGQRGLLA